MTDKSTFLIYGAGGEEQGFATNEFLFPIKTIIELTELERCISESRDAYKRFVSFKKKFEFYLLESLWGKSALYWTGRKKGFDRFVFLKSFSID